MTKVKSQHRGRRWMVWVGGIIVVIFVILLLLPSILSYIIVPGMIQSAVASQVKGKVEVSGTSFSWFGSQEIETIKITSAADDTNLDASVTIERSLLGLLFGWPDIGKVDVKASGKGTLGSDGSTSFTNLIGSSQPAKEAPSKDAPALPAGLNVDVVLDISSLELVSKEMNSSVKISGLEGEFAVRAGGPIDIKLTTKIESDGQQGSLDLDFGLENGVASDGRLQLANASLNGKVKGRSLHLPANGEWVEINAIDLSANSKALGDGLHLEADASGSLQNSTPISLQAKLDLTSIVSKEGTFAFGPESISGSVKAQSIPTSLLQPFLGDSPFQLVRDVGPQLNLSMDATSGSTRSMQIEADAQFLKANAVVTVGPEKISDGTVTIDMTASKAVLEQAGIQGDGDVQVAVKGSGLGMNLGSDGQLDMGSFAGEFDVTTTGALGAAGAGKLKLSGLTAKIVTQGLQKGVSLDAGGKIGAATLKANANINDLLVNGEVDAENVSVVSSVSLTNFDLNSLQPFLGEEVPPGFLNGAAGGPVNLDVKLNRAQSIMTVDAKASAQDLDGSADVKITETSLQVSALDLKYKINPAMIDAFMPEPNTTGHLVSQVSVVMSSKNLVYDLGAEEDVPVGDRVGGEMQISVDNAAFALVNPPETVVFKEIVADVNLSKQHALSMEVNAKVATDKKPIGSLKAEAQVKDLAKPAVPTVSLTLDVADTSQVASIAGMDPGLLGVLLGSSAKVNMAVSPPTTADTSMVIAGTVKSPHADGQFQANVMDSVIDTAKADFTTKLVPGDFKKSLGADSTIRLKNDVTASATINVTGYAIGGAPNESGKVIAKVSASSMQLTGEDGTTIVVNNTNGTASIHGRNLKADFTASIANRSGKEGNGRVKLSTNAKLPQGEEAFQIGNTVLELESVPTFILELVGAEGRLAEAALGNSVNSKATIAAAGPGRSSVKAQLTSPYASMELPQAWLENSLFDVPADKRLHAQLKVSQELSREILSVLHPIFADITNVQRPISLTVGPLTLPLSGDQTSKMNGIGVLDIGDVTLKSTSFGSRLLMFLGQQDGASVPAHFSPLKVTATNGMIEYKDFTVEVGKGDGTSYAQKLIFNGKINLASNPPEVIGISASFPATNLVGAFKELQKVPPGLLATIRPKVTFYGPLYDAQGNRIPLKSKIDPLNLDEGLKPEQIPGIIQGIGDLIRNKK